MTLATTRALPPTALLGFVALCVPVRQEPVSAPEPYERVILISVDGLRSDALDEARRGALPGFARFFADGATTLNARTDPDYTVTLPNHTSMLTGRPVEGDEGHGWVENDDPRDGDTLHKQKGAYVAGLFDVAHDHGLRTALLTGKSKFEIFDTSWNGEHGAPDRVGEDDGRDKIDEFAYEERIEDITAGVLAELRASEPRALIFVHYPQTDAAGHSKGWDMKDGSAYRRAVAAVDHELVRLFEALAEDERTGRVAVVLTTDHGGGEPFKGHNKADKLVDYRIPFLVWTGDEPEAADLYRLNPETRGDPGKDRVPLQHEGHPPVRNGDAANLVLGLLGLPAVPGSTLNPDQDLRVR